MTARPGLSWHFSVQANGACSITALNFCSRQPCWLATRAGRPCSPGSIICKTSNQSKGLASYSASCHHLNKPAATLLLGCAHVGPPPAGPSGKLACQKPATASQPAGHRCAVRRLSGCARRITMQLRSPSDPTGHMEAREQLLLCA